MSRHPIVDTIAHWAYAKTWETVENTAQSSMLDSLVDTVGVALAGSHEQVSGIARDYVTANGSDGPCDIWGLGRKAAPGGAAFANGTAAMSQEFDDRYVASGHPSCSLVPALIAIAQSERLTGREVLASYAAGLGVFGMIGYLYGSHLEPRLEIRGWQVTGVLGCTAVCAAVAKAIGLEPAGIANAIGVSVSMTAGSSANMGTPTKAIHPGRAAQSGIDAALLARAGLQSSRDALEGERGGMVAFGHGSGRAIFDGGTQFSELVTIADSAPSGLIRKCFPTLGATHLAIEAALEVRDMLPRSAKLRSVCLRLPRGAAVLGFDGRPSIAVEARHSYPYVVAVALAHGVLLPRHFADDELFDEKTSAIWDIVRLEEDATSGYTLGDVASKEMFAEVTATVADGEQFRARRVNPPRSASGEAVSDKFLGCAGEVMKQADAQVLLERLRSLADLRSLESLFVL